jgi:PST family polysaccharide transporter
VKLVTNFLLLIGGEVVSKLATFVAFAYLARVAGPVGFGYVEFAGAVLLCAGLIVDQGFGPYGAREIARAPARTPSLVSEIVLVRFILAVGAYAAVVTFALLHDSAPVMPRLLLIYGLSLLAMPLLLQWVFQGHDCMRTVALVQLIRQSVFSVLVLALVRDASQIWLVAVAEVAGVCSAAAYGVWAYWRRFGRLRLAGARISKRLFIEGVPIGLSQMFWVVKMLGATLILGLIAPAEDVGFFAGAMRILVALHAFVWLYYFNLLPSLARTWQQGDGAFAQLISRSMHGVAWVGLGGGLVWLALAPSIMTSVYGAAFAPAGSTLQWMAGVCVVAAVSGHYRFGLIASGRQTAEMVSAALGAVVAASLLPIGYAFAGLKGAAMALLAAEVVVWLTAWWCSYRLLNLTGHVRLLARPLLAWAFAAGLVWALPIQSRALQIVIITGSILLFAITFDATLRNHCLNFHHLRRRQVAQQLSKRLPEVTR